ncbi:MAG: GbsR/MarR family transcriptional regulator [Gammaproteobacteria bacterium]
MELSPTVQKYILHWGEMGSRWGVNRTIAQIHALLYLSPAALPAEDIARILSVARSNVSTSLRELHSYGLIKVTHRLGDRRDHFEALTDVWELFAVILDQRKRREIDPTLAVLRQCSEDAENDEKTDAQTKARIHDMLDFVEQTTTWYEQMRQVPKPVILKLMKLGAKIVKVVPKP